MKYIGIPNFGKPRRQNLKATERQTKNTRVARDYNERWARKFTYHITLTSMSDTSVLIDQDVRAESLRALMLNVVSEMGKLNRRRVSHHFSVTLVRKPDEKEMRTESIPFAEGRALPATEPRITNNNPIDQELEL